MFKEICCKQFRKVKFKAPWQKYWNRTMWSIFWPNVIQTGGKTCSCEPISIKFILCYKHRKHYPKQTNKTALLISQAFSQVCGFLPAKQKDVFHHGLSSEWNKKKLKQHSWHVIIIMNVTETDCTCKKQHWIFLFKTAFKRLLNYYYYQVCFIFSKWNKTKWLHIYTSNK